MKAATWILVADSSRGRLYSVPTNGTTWSVVGEYSHAGSRATEGELTTDQPGRMNGSGGSRSAMQSRTSPKEVEFEHFAHELVGVLHDGHGQQAYDKIVLVAPPHFLGLLRKMLNATVTKLVVATLDKDYLHLADKEMHEHLDPVIRTAHMKPA